MGCGTSRPSLQQHADSTIQKKRASASEKTVTELTFQANSQGNLQTNMQCSTDLPPVEVVPKETGSSATWSNHSSEEKPSVAILGDAKAPTSKADDKQSESQENNAEKRNEDVNERASKDDGGQEGSKEEETGKKKMKDLTPEEINEMIKSQIEYLKENVTGVLENPIYDEQDITLVTFRNRILRIGKIYFALKGAPRSDIVRFRHEAALVLMNTKCVDFLCKFIMHVLREKKYKTSEGKTVLEFYNPMKTSLIILLNFTDAERNLSVSVCEVPGFLECICETLNQCWEEYSSRKATELSDEDRIIKTMLGLIHNTAMCEDCETCLRSCNFTSVLLKYMDSRLAMCRLSAISALADIVDEKECDLLQSNTSGIKFLLKNLKKALKDKQRKELGWSAGELGRTVGRLARNDANKRLLVEEGCLPFLVELEVTGDTAEKQEAMESVWVLSFDDDNKEKMMQEEGLLKMVVDEYNNATEKQVRKAAQGILWNLRKLLDTVPEYKDIVSVLEGKDVSFGKPDKSKGHLMISYQWGDQAVLINVKEILKSHGYSVWMDVDDMQGSTLQAMANAIENASVILVCMSQRYKDSPNCRAEAEYAFSKRKEIVPLLMEPGYRPDGWLGMILGAKLFFDFSGKYSFDVKMEGLKKEVAKRLGGDDSGIAHDVTDGSSEKPIVKASHARFYAAPEVKSSTDRVKQWTAQDVHKWLSKHGLKGEKLERLSGREVAFLRSLRHEAPEFFYRTLETKLDIDNLLGLVNFTEAMDDLTP